MHFQLQFLAHTTHTHPRGAKVSLSLIISRFLVSVSSVHVLNFALMANDRVTKVGCGATRYYNELNKRSYVYYVCNYSHNNVLGQPVYRKGTKCAKCGTPNVCSPTDDGLCAGIGDTIDKEL